MLIISRDFHTFPIQDSKEWKYTDKGWFCYELCVPEPPEVSEIVDGSSVD